ncbi:MAG: AAA family ATPase [SAR324 cluster bacterium]|nr:AAA family ATPase [SAR324 cluster bacterium]
MEKTRPSPSTISIPPDPFTLLTPHEGYLKVLIWGPAGSGKTVWSLGADDVAYISLESGADRYAQLGISAFSPRNLAELGQTIRFLMHAQYQYQTIVVDTVSVCWSMFMEEYCQEGVKPDWAKIKVKWKRFLRTLLSLRKDVILIGRAKEARSESSWYKKTGDLILDSEISTAFEFDFVGFAYTSYHPETEETHYKVRLEKVRDLTGKVKTGMVMTNSTFKQFKTKLGGLTKTEANHQGVQLTGEPSKAAGVVHPRQTNKQSSPPQFVS